MEYKTILKVNLPCFFAGVIPVLSHFAGYGISPLPPTLVDYNF